MVRSLPSLLIRNAALWNGGGEPRRGDLLIEGGRFARIAPKITDAAAARVIDAKGGLMLPGLRDNHAHLAGLAARRQSVWCGPSQVCDPDALAAALASAPGQGWIRGIGYHESVMDGLPDARALDRLVPDRPLRVQHRSGRMWLLNSRALEELLATGKLPPGLEREGTRFTGRLFDEDAWLRTALSSEPPDFAEISAELASYGVTGITDMTPQNGPQMAAHFSAQRESGALLQAVVLAGTLDLMEAPTGNWSLGPVKLHLHEAELPPIDDTVALIRAAHDQGRAVAVHCVSEVELVFALAVLDEAGTITGDRIEHASIALPAMIGQIAGNGLAVCVQPHFVAERGDRYLLDVEPSSRPHLYRLASLSSAGIALAGGSDAPFASHDPWAAMRAAVSRRTADGAVIGADEALTPEQAIALYLVDPEDLSRQRILAEGAPADLCLLDRNWSEARERLVCEDVVLTLVSGKIVHDFIDKSPIQRRFR